MMPSGPIMSSTHTLSVNGATHQVTVEHNDTPLLYVLRDDLGLKGTRFGCGTGDCGACVVMVDGRTERSCQLPVWSVEGRAIRTIESLSSGGRLHPLQQAFIDFQAGQCGYCLSGIIMTALELIESGGEPSRQKIVNALDENLCRCGAHIRILKAIEAAWKNARKESAR
jgi:aerobic-type carbon monoxide dehydrogenase small subunit (CoxS/CutS family)